MLKVKNHYITEILSIRRKTPNNQSLIRVFRKTKRERERERKRERERERERERQTETETERTKTNPCTVKMCIFMVILVSCHSTAV